MPPKVTAYKKYLYLKLLKRKLIRIHGLLIRRDTKNNGKCLVLNYVPIPSSYTFIFTKNPQQRIQKMCAIKVFKFSGKQLTALPFSSYLDLG